MPMSREQKQAMVEEVSEVLTRAHSAVVAEYRGLTAGEMDTLRLQAREGGAYLKVVKNNLAKRAVEGTDYECMVEAFVGPIILGLSLEDAGAAARVIHDFRKEHEALDVKAVAISGKLLPASELERLAKLPTREQALAMLMGIMQAPISKLVRTVAEPQAKLARSLAAVRDQKQAA